MRKMLVLLLSGVILAGVSAVYAQVETSYTQDYYQATMLLLDDKYSEALEKVNTLIEQSPDNADYYLLRGQIQEEMNNKRAALADFDKAAELAPKNDDIFYYRASLKMDMASPQAAYVDSTRCIHLNPNNSMCYFLRSMVRRELGDDAGASADMGRAQAAQRNTHRSQKSVSK